MADNKSRVYAVAILDDMFFASKIRQAAESAGLDIEFMKGAEWVTGAALSGTPSLVIVDLANKKINALELIGILKGLDNLKGARVLGYLPHVEKGLMKDALDAGYDIVLPRSRFSHELIEILAGITAAGGGTPLTQ